MNNLNELLAKGDDVTIGQHVGGLTGFFVRVGFAGEAGWEASSHGDTVEDAIQNALDRSNHRPEALHVPDDFEPDIAGWMPEALHMLDDFEADTDGRMPEDDHPRPGAPDFRDELRSLINRFSLENQSNTPDLILRDYLCACLAAFDYATKARDDWFGLGAAVRPRGES